MIGKTNAIGGVSAPVPKIRTVSGSVITVSDALAMPAVSLVVDINAVQNLNGYDNPWPAGGGKNLLEWSNTSTTINGVTFTVNDDGSVLANGKASADASFYATVNGYTDLKAGTYIINGCPSGGSNTTYLINETVKSVTDTGSGGNLTLSEDTRIRVRILIRNGYTANNLLFKPMIRLASVTDATYAPYSNICPISGWSAVNVYREAQYDAGATPYATINLNGTVYGGLLNVTTGVLTKVPYYNSYNGETLVGPWVSSMDKYVSGATPTTGAQVVDLGGTGTDVQLTATEVQMLLGNNTLWADSGDSELQYWARR